MEVVAAWTGSNNKERAKSKKLRIKNNGEEIPPVENTSKSEMIVRIMVEGKVLLSGDLLAVLIILKTK